MKVIQDITKLFEQDSVPTLSIRVDVELSKEDTFKERDWLMNKLHGAISSYQHHVVTQEPEARKFISEYKKCPITGADIDGTIGWRDAIVLGLLSLGDRKSLKDQVKKPVENPDRFHDFNESFCTISYRKKVDGIEMKHKLITILL